jgi:hypothetical protein
MRGQPRPTLVSIKEVDSSFSEEKRSKKTFIRWAKDNPAAEHHAPE